VPEGEKEGRAFDLAADASVFETPAPGRPGTILAHSTTERCRIVARGPIMAAKLLKRFQAFLKRRGYLRAAERQALVMPNRKLAAKKRVKKAKKARK
jgi:hypothetical protein